MKTLIWTLVILAGSALSADVKLEFEKPFHEPGLREELKAAGVTMSSISYRKNTFWITVPEAQRTTTENVVNAHNRSAHTTEPTEIEIEAQKTAALVRAKKYWKKIKETDSELYAFMLIVLEHGVKPKDLE